MKGEYTMSNRTQLEKKIETHERELADLKAKALEKEAFLHGLREALKFMPKEEVDEKTSRQELRVGSYVEKVRDLLEKAGKPMHVDDILRATGRFTSMWKATR